MNTRTLYALVRKDLLVYFTDRRAVILTFVVPLMLASFMGFLFRGKSDAKEKYRIPILIVDEDQSPLTRSIIKSVQADADLAVQDSTRAAARQAVGEGKFKVAVVFGKEFGAQAVKAFFQTQNKPELLLFYDPSHSATVGMVRGILIQHTMQIVSKEAYQGDVGMDVLKATLAALDDQPDFGGKERSALKEMFGSILKWQVQSKQGSSSATKDKLAPAGIGLPYELREEQIVLGKVTYNSYAHAFAGNGIQFLMFSAIETGTAILTERQRGLWKRMRAAPLPRKLILISRMISGALIALATLLVLFGLGIAVFHVQIGGSAAGFLLIAAASSLMAASFGLLLAALGKTPQATRGIAVLVVLLLAMLGGAWVPSFIFPTWLQSLTLAIPTRWAIDGLEAMTWRGLGFSSALRPTGVLLGFAVIFFALAFARFRWDAE